MYRISILKSKTFFLFFLLFQTVSLFGGMCYFVGFKSVPADNSHNTIVKDQKTLGETLLTVLGKGHSYNPVSGDTVFLSWGRYMLTSEITIPRGVTVIGGYYEHFDAKRLYPGAYPWWPGSPLYSATILDGNSFLSLPADKHRVATVYGTLETCHVRNGHSSKNGGGLYVDGGTVIACIIRGNVAMNKDYNACGGGAYITGGGKMYYCLVANNMSNRGFGIYVDGEKSVASNVTMVYNTWAPRPILIKGTGGNNGKTITDTSIYFSHEAHTETQDAGAAKDVNLRIQLSDFYMAQTATTVMQYCCFFAAIDYDISRERIFIPASSSELFAEMEAFTTSDGIKNIAQYYNFSVPDMSNYLICNGNLSDFSRFIGAGVNNIETVNVLYPQEKYGNGDVPADEISISNINWYGAVAYSHWLGGVLPTEAQWEFALRRTKDVFSGNNATGVSVGAYPYGDGTSGEAENYAWYRGNSNGTDADGTTAGNYGDTDNHAHRAGQKSPSPLGLYDMSGNLSEWCADWYNGSAYNNTATHYWYDDSDGKLFLNPIYKKPTSWRVNRGGSWYYTVTYLRSGFRELSSPLAIYTNLGFRPAWCSSGTEKSSQ
jgi:formylglycine-generating enzyme required for sulfatase activity